MGILLSIVLIVAILYFYLEHSANKAQCSVAENDRIWLQNSFHWLVTEFGIEKLKSVRVLRPIPEDFPIDADGSVQSVYGVLRLIATQMDIDFSRIKLSFFKQTVLSAEELLEGKTAPAGLYKGVDESGYFQVGIREDLKKDSLNLIATLAHELAHIKLLGENRITTNDEHLTDLTTIIFGFGLMNANAALQINQSYDAYERTSSYQFSTLGYLHQKHYAYALALFSYYRGEEKPEWQKYLSPNVELDFKNNMRYIFKNEKTLFENE